MTNVGFGGYTTTSSYTGAGIYTAVSIGARRLAANGQGPQIITNVGGYLGGRGGACIGTIYLGSSSASITVASAPNGAGYTGYINTSDWYIANGTTANYGFNATGGSHSFYFGRTSTGTTYDTSGGSWTGTAGGAYTYVQSPSAPGNLTVISTIMGEADVSWNHAGTGSPVVAGDNGGTVVTGSRIQYSLVETFGSGVTTVEISGIGTTTAHITGLTPGATYFFRVASKNAVTTAASTTSVWSVTKSVYVMVDAALAYETLHPSQSAVTPLQDGAFWSLNGHGIGFDRAGNMIKPSTAPYTYNYYNPQTTSYMTQKGTISYNLVKVNNTFTDVPVDYVGAPLDPFIVYPTDGSDKIFANNIQYASFLPRKINSTTNSVYRMAYKTRLWYPDANEWYNTKNYFPHEISWEGLPNDSFLFTGQKYYVKIDDATKTVYVKVNYINASGVQSVVEATNSFSTLYMGSTGDINVYLEYKYDTSFNYTLNVIVCSPTDLETYVTTTATYTAKRSDIYCTPVVVKGVARSLYVTNSSHQALIPPYQWEASDIGYQTNKLTYSENEGKVNKLSGPSLGVNMNGWEYFQAAAAASNMELSLENDVINVRYLGSNSIDLTNVVPTFSITPSTTFSGKQVEVQYNNTSAVSITDATSTTIPKSRPEEMYNAYFDNNQAFSVNAGEVLKKTVKTNNYPLLLVQPTRVASMTDPTTGKVLFTSAKDLYGQYSVSDKAGHLLGVNIFEASGGKVEVAINPDIPNAIDITFTGPDKTIPGYDGPYTLSINDGKTTWSSLSILGYGLKTDPQKIKLLTGSTPSKTPQDVAKSIANPFIDTLERAYDQGAWPATDASGPRVNISGTIPTTSLPNNGFGVASGSIIKYNNNSYRINDLTIGNIQTSFNASRYVTVSDFDNAWMQDGVPRTVGFHDGVWDGKEVQDEIVLSYYGTTGIDGVFIDIDTDGHPDIAFNMDGYIGEFVLLFDTDGVPYYEPISAGQRATLLYLDADFSPYYL